MSKTFSQESSEAFLIFTKSALRRKKNLPACFNRLLWKELRWKDPVLFGFSKKKLVGTLPFLLNMGFHYKTSSKNSWKIVLSKVLLMSRCKCGRSYALRFHWYTHCFYWIQ